MNTVGPNYKTPALVIVMTNVTHFNGNNIKVAPEIDATAFDGRGRTADG